MGDARNGMVEATAGNSAHSLRLPQIQSGSAQPILVVPRQYPNWLRFLGAFWYGDGQGTNKAQTGKE
jgi:hypothetical protein